MKAASCLSVHKLSLSVVSLQELEYGDLEVSALQVSWVAGTKLRTRPGHWRTQC